MTYEFSWEETPFRYDPVDGTNLLLEFGNPFGFSVSSPRFDATAVANGRVILQTPELPDRGETPYYYHLFVTQFVYRPASQVPEPGGLALASLLGAIGVATSTGRRLGHMSGFRPLRRFKD